MTTFGVGDKFTISGSSFEYTLRSYNQEHDTYEVYADRYSTDYGADYAANEVADYFGRGYWAKVDADIPVGKKIRANYEGSMWTLVVNDDGTYDLAYPVGDARFGGRTTNRYTRDRIKEAIRTGTWSVIDDSEGERVTLEPVEDISPADQERDHIIDRLRTELAILQNDRNSMMEVRQQNEDRRIQFLEYLATVAEDPDSFGVGSSRMCENFDAAMIRHGHYSRSEVNAAREKATPNVTVHVEMSRVIEVPRSIMNDRSAVWRYMVDADLVDQYMIDEISETDD